MPLPININALLHGRAVESERIEFKEGWNPEGILHAVCAFANDFHNWGGGYLVLGVKTEDGKPILPPIGLQPEQADAWQRKLLELGHRLQPAYHPISEPATVDNRLVLVVWVLGGEMRPYKAPVSLAGDNREWAYFIRLHANTVRARGEVEQELISLANRIPFDDRQNAAAPVSELKPNLIQSFLAEVKSDLQAEAASLPLEELGRRMQIVRGPFEAPRPLNVGLLFFTPEPAGWFPQTQIDIVHLPQGRGGTPQVTPQVGTKSAPSRHQVGTKSAPSRNTAHVPDRQSVAGPVETGWPKRPHQVPAPSFESTSCRPAHRNDHPR